MNDNILDMIRTMIATDEAYDQDLLFHINSALHVVAQLGVGDVTFTATPASTWGDFTTDERLLGVIKDYVYVRTRLEFDPPSNGYTVEVYKERQKEYENRILYEVD